jgi:hypothetical protein
MRRDTIVSKIGGNVLVVRISTSQLGNVRMFKRVIPGDFFASLIDFVTVVANPSSLKVNELPNVQDHTALEAYLSSSLASVGPMVARTSVERWMLG